MAARNLPTFSLDEVPYFLAGHIYEGEKQASRQVTCPRSHYLVVLALRFILSYVDIHVIDTDGWTQDYDTWKVFWRVERPGHTSIYLYRERLELIDHSSGTGKLVEVQTEVWHELAILEGSETLTSVRLNTGQPYNTYVPLPAAQGIRRLIEDAAHASQGTPSHPFTSINDPGRLIFTVTRNADYSDDERELFVTLDIDDQDRVSEVCLRVNFIEPPDPYDDEDYERGYGYY